MIHPRLTLLPFVAIVIASVACTRDSASHRDSATPSRSGDHATASADPSNGYSPELPLEPTIYVFHCDGFDFVVHYDGLPAESVRLNLSGRSVELPRVESDSGARYSDGEIVFTQTRDSATLRLDGRTYTGCTREPAADVWHAAKLTGVDFRALGQEPGWILDIERGNRIVMNADYGTRRIVFPYNQPAADSPSGATTYRVETADHTLEVLIEDKLCHDAMSGQRFDHAVTVTLDGRTYHGCGREL